MKVGVRMLFTPNLKGFVLISDELYFIISL